MELRLPPLQARDERHCHFAEGGAAYADFRRQVLEYEDPCCSNCPFVPCDDIKGAPFPFDCDCLGATIPCGRCLWCMGGLQCLL